MISRAHRFQGNASLRFVYQKGRTVRGELVTLKFAPNARRTSYRAAVVVSRKVDKSAVVRNRLRRRLYEAIRQTETHITDAYDLVFTVFDARLDELSPNELYLLVQSQLVQADVLSGSAKANPANHDIVNTRKT